MLVDKVARFLVELGAGFSYVGKALPISGGGDELELDLLFYHVVLHRYVVIVVAEFQDVAAAIDADKDQGAAELRKFDPGEEVWG